nr:PREDICTED: isoprenoid synthase domain-containing protein-like [Latimeria chalumnae]|eukprot:XP_005997598.1 PREDICTED: isoprenoid synthase domain-containing protein-like [Latimeria chalumnae]
MDSLSNATEELSGLKQLARGAKLINVLVYGLVISYTKDTPKIEDAVSQGATIIGTLIKDRNPVLIAPHKDEHSTHIDICSTETIGPYGCSVHFFDNYSSCVG